MKDLLQNTTVTELLKKAGLNESQVSSAVSQLSQVFEEKTKKAPDVMGHLVSNKPNTQREKDLEHEMENDFLHKLQHQLGVPESTVKSLKGKMPEMVTQLSGILNSKGVNSLDGLQGMFGHVTDLLDGQPKKNNPIGGLFNRFFGKKA